METVRKRDFGLSSQLSDYEPPFIKPHVDQKVQRTGVAARCCTTVRRVTRNSGNAECLKIVDNSRALVRPDAPLGVARYVAVEFHRNRMTTRSAYGSCREALRIANACSVTPRTVYLWSEPENRQRQARREEPLHVDAQVNGRRWHGSTSTSPMVCPLSLPGRGARKQLPHRAHLRP